MFCYRTYKDKQLKWLSIIFKSKCFLSVLTVFFVDGSIFKDEMVTNGFFVLIFDY